ncbi:MAG: dipeptidase PepV [Clostridiales Family XIII bacterium]|jgi:succinyl-diaminopimelate desuccinylase|nr:dipeptidase PepV [Clostridiales Family XIII bacterium]
MNYNEIIDSKKDEIVSMLRELIAYKSVRGEPSEAYPFGEEVQRVFEYMLEKGRIEGLDTVNIDNFGGHLEWIGAVTDARGEIVAAAKETVGIPVHLDVVPEGSGWTYDPYGGEISDGKIYGRGTTDNKCAAASVFFAIKALKDSGYIPSRNVRLILGLNEETGWSGMYKYLERAGEPDLGFVPDGDFPAVNGEMGILIFELAKKFGKTNEKGIVLRSIEGGNAPNMVPDRARAIIMDEINKDFENVKEQLAAFRERTGYKINGKGVGKAFEITVTGLSAHGAYPQLGVNAVSILMAFLGELHIANESIRDFVGFYNEHIGFELDGEGLGIGFSDEPSGKLILNVGMIGMDSEAVIVTINTRSPVTIKEDEVYDALMPLVHKHNLGVVKLDSNPSIYFAPDSPFIETLMDVYRENTGDTESKPFVFGGGTYARVIPNAVAFGPSFPHTPDLMHQKDEYINIDDLIKITHIYADAIYRLTGACNNP